MFIPTDYRIWEVKDDKDVSLGAFLYGDMVIQFNNSRTCISGAYAWLTHIGYTYKEIGNVYPLDKVSEDPLIEAIRVKFRAKERKRLLKARTKKGFKLNSTLKFGKHYGKTIQEVINNHNDYWRWLIKENVLMLHPELDKFL